MECLASGRRSSLVLPLFFSRAVFFCRVSRGGSTNDLCILMNPSISISGSFFPRMMLLMISTVARHKMPTVSVVVKYFLSFFVSVSFYLSNTVAVYNCAKSLWGWIDAVSVWVRIHLSMTETEPNGKCMR